VPEHEADAELDMEAEAAGAFVKFKFVDSIALIYIQIGQIFIYT